MSPAEGAVLLAASLLAGAVNVVAGGGSLATVPVLILLGLPPSLALGTNRASMGALSVTGLVAYQRSRVVRWRLAAVPAALASLGAVAGARVMVEVDERTLRTVIGAVMLVLVAVVLARPEARLRQRGTGADGPRHGAAGAGPGARVARGLLALALGFYGGFYGAGVSTLFIVAFVALDGLSYLEAAAATQVVVGSLSLVAAVALVAVGHVSWPHAAVMTAGLALGGYAGARLAVRGGERFVRLTVAAVSVALAVKLLLG